MRKDLPTILGLLADRAITPQVAATVRLAEIVAAVELVESRTVRGNVVLAP